MATKQKKSTSKKTNNNKSKGANTKAKNNKSNSFQDEIVLLIVIAISILLFISTYVSQSGIIGDAISKFFFGLFGVITYIMPFYIVFISIFKISNKRSKLARRKIIFSAILLLVVSTFAHILTIKYESSDISVFNNLTEYYKTSAESKTAGGIIGGLFGNLLFVLFGKIGSFVVTLLLVITTTILLTEKSFIKLVKMLWNKLYDYIKSDFDEEEDTILKEPKKSKEEKVKDKKNKKYKYASEDTTGMLERVTIAPELNIDFMNDEVPTIIPEVETATSPEPIVELQQVSTVETPEKKKSTVKSKEEEPLNIDLHNSPDEQNTYKFPPIDLLTKSKAPVNSKSKNQLKENAQKLQQTLENFGVNVTITNISCGPSVTRYELQPEQGVKVSRVVSLADDIKLNLAAADIRIEAPIPGKAAIGIEVPNSENQMVYLRDIIESEEFKKHPSDIAFAVGKDIGGQVIVTDIGKMPHLLIAGSTGSGKSVCINTLITSILYKSKPSDVRMIMIDPKVVELSVYNGIPHLLIPVVTDPKKAASALNWAVAEMTDRYKKFAEHNVRDLKGYNSKIADLDTGEEKLPQIVIIVDELADLMMIAPSDVEDAICRLAQMARAAGIHLVIATQRPSVNVITGLIKANVPSRIAFAVSSGVDSRTIIDMNGAEKLLGKGDMLFYPVGLQKPTRVQGAFISDKEVSSIVEFLSADKSPEYNENVISQITNAQTDKASPEDDLDIYFEEAARFVIEKDKASIGMLQRVYRIGFNRAARIMDQLYDAGVVGPEEGTKPRRVLMTIEEFEGRLSDKED